ncbi:ArnT family glycosyltransferase [Fusobacterium sp.]|uniref:ArnT family glycosyltransferase n=1 Tax=Fusobacterium sp. TaxID=68766 RepID=UPI0029024F7C|nr:glycosyltransferase family 39 protein [Fusobacterium sp.]MDU1911500.1 glycosyltransferase family 39 protein [Fusobacterium sp.]
MSSEDKKYSLIILVLSIISFFSNLWVKDADLMEARNFITAREMVESENWLIPTLNGNLRFEKPPLPTWITAGMMKLFHNTTDEFLLRIPVAIISVMLIFLIYYLVKILTEKSLYSFIAAFISLTTFMLIKTGNENSWDMYSYAFAFGAVAFFTAGIKKEKMNSFIISGIFLACSILSKGPVALYGLTVPFIISYGYVYGIEKYKKNWRGILIMLGTTVLLSGIWPVLVLLNYKEIFLNVMEKEKDTWTSKHTQGIFFYLDYFIYMGIWIFFSAFGMIKKWSKERTEDKKFFDFIFLWNLLVLVLLSLIKMKKKRYGIPIYITSSLMVSSTCSYYYQKSWNELKKSDRLLFQIQSIFIWIVSLGIPIFLLIGRYIKKDISLSYILIVLTIMIPFYFWMYIAKNHKARVKNIILGSGILMLIANNTTNWFIEREIREKNDKNIPKISMAKKSPIQWEVYSEDFEIEDVWNIGKQIKKFDEKMLLKDELVILENDELDMEKFKDYFIADKKIFTRGNNDIVKLFYLEKLEDVNEDFDNRSSRIHRFAFNRGTVENK